MPLVRHSNGGSTLQSVIEIRKASVLVRTRFTSKRGQGELPGSWRTLTWRPGTEATYGENAVSSESRNVALDVLDAQRAQQLYRQGQSYLPVPHQ